MEEVPIRKTLLRKLYDHGYWGKRHTSFDNLPKGFPAHLHKEVKKVAKQLIREGLIVSKPTHYGLGVSLNPRMIKEIKKEV